MISYSSYFNDSTRKKPSFFISRYNLGFDPFWTYKSIFSSNVILCHNYLEISRYLNFTIIFPRYCHHIPVLRYEGFTDMSRFYFSSHYCEATPRFINYVKNVQAMFILEHPKIQWIFWFLLADVLVYTSPKRCSLGLY